MSGVSWTTITDAAEAAAKGAAAGSIVPGVGTIVGGLIGAAASIGGHWLPDSARPALAQAAAAITGVSDEAGQIAAITADPTHADAFRLEVLRIAADQEAAKDAALQARLDGMDADRANARAQLIALVGAGSRIAWAAPVVSVVVIVAFAVVVTLVLFRPMPAGSEAIMAGLVGTMGSLATVVVGYWVGSSAGSAEKTRLLAGGKPE